jgi:hypothetical protein
VVSAASSVRGKKLRVELFVYLCDLLTGEAAGGGEVGDRFEVVSCPPGRLQSSIHPVVSPTFLKRCTMLRGMKTMVPGPAVEVWPSTVSL